MQFGENELATRDSLVRTKVVPKVIFIYFGKIVITSNWNDTRYVVYLKKNTPIWEQNGMTHERFESSQIFMVIKKMAYFTALS